VELTSTVRSEEKYVSPDVVVAPGGWCTCTCTCCWCHCHISNAGTFEDDRDDQEL
jgi:hypothetical protein